MGRDNLKCNSFKQEANIWLHYMDFDDTQQNY